MVLRIGKKGAEIKMSILAAFHFLFFSHLFVHDSKHIRILLALERSFEMERKFCIETVMRMLECTELKMIQSEHTLGQLNALNLNTMVNAYFLVQESWSQWHAWNAMWRKRKREKMNAPDAECGVVSNSCECVRVSMLSAYKHTNTRNRPVRLTLSLTSIKHTER